MSELALHPGVYATGESNGLVPILEQLWVRQQHPGDGTLYIISGFATYNGGVRFYDTFREHVEMGGRIVAFLGGKAGWRLTSRQVVEELLRCGVKVNLINRKKQLHAKCYGASNSTGDSIVVTSGNFTGPGMSQNIEMSVLLDPALCAVMGFSWERLVERIRQQQWEFYEPELGNDSDPAWQLVYDEEAATIRLDETEQQTMILTLSHSDTARIKASPGERAGEGSQYFWLPKDSYAFFPPLTIRNERGVKRTYACEITLRYVDVDPEPKKVRVTLEAENNVDFRLGTGGLRYSRVAAKGDLAALSRVGERQYELRLFRRDSELFSRLFPYAVYYIGGQAKQYGYIANQDFANILGTPLNRPPMPSSVAS